MAETDSYVVYSRDYKVTVDGHAMRLEGAAEVREGVDAAALRSLFVKGCTVIGGERIIVCHDYKANLRGKPYEDFISVCNRAGIQVRVFGDSWYSSDTVRLEFRNASLHVDD